MELFNTDLELSLDDRNEKFFVCWQGQSVYEEPWQIWSNGNIYINYPNICLYSKMLRIADAVNSRVMDDDGIVYRGQNDWGYLPGGVISDMVLSN